MNDNQEKQFVEAAKRLLDESVSHLDGSTLSGLAQARKQALAGGKGQKSLFRRPWPMVGMTASAMALTAVVLFVLLGPPFRQDTVETNMVTDLGLLTSEESLEFFEDIEFYEWFSTVEVGQEDMSRLHGSLPPAGHAATGPLPGAGSSG